LNPRLLRKRRLVAVFVSTWRKRRLVWLLSVVEALIALWPLRLSELTLRLHLLLAAAASLLSRHLPLTVAATPVLARLPALHARAAALAVFARRTPLAALASAMLFVLLSCCVALRRIRKGYRRHHDEGRQEGSRCNSRLSVRNH
jgi:hypothetical protein